MTRFCIPIVACLIISPASQALAASANVLFNANVDATCTLVVSSNGTMTADSSLQNISSKNAGGSAGSVSVSTTGGVNISLLPVASFTVPVADVGAITWTPEYSLTGSHNTTLTSSTTALTTPGNSVASVHLTGTKAGANRFAGGNYQATVTITCE